MSDFDEIPDWYDGDQQEQQQPEFDEEFEPDSPKPRKKTKSQPAKSAAKKVRKPKKVSKTQDSPERHVPSKATNLTMRDIKSTLKDVFGHDSFRGEVQEDAIRTLCLGQSLK